MWTIRKIIEQLSDADLDCELEVAITSTEGNVYINEPVVFVDFNRKDRIITLYT